MDKDKTIEIIKDSYGKSEVLRRLNLKINGGNLRKLSRFIESNEVDISHFDSKKRQRKYELIKKECPTCGKIFKARKGHPREKTTCSYSCANTHFRSGENNGCWKEDSYRTTCFLYHGKKCIICDEDKIVEVHHFDHNTNNNKPENLIPLCSNHHKYYHSKHRNLIFGDIIKYRDSFMQKQLIESGYKKQVTEDGYILNPLIKSEPILAKPRKLKTKWTPVFVQDIMDS